MGNHSTSPSNNIWSLYLLAQASTVRFPAKFKFNTNTQFLDVQFPNVQILCYTLDPDLII